MGVAGALANVLGGQPVDVKAQDGDIVAQSLGKLFHSSEHMPVDNVANIDEEGESYELENDFDTVTEIDENDDIDDTAEPDVAIQFLQIKEEMKRLGFDDYNDYLDYLDYMKSRGIRKKDNEMEM